MKVFDTDAHVEESEETFAALQGRKFGDSAPRVIAGERRAFWLIEGRTFPRLAGKGVHTFGSPHLRREAGHVDAERRARIESQGIRGPKGGPSHKGHTGNGGSGGFPSMV